MNDECVGVSTVDLFDPLIADAASSLRCQLTAIAESEEEALVKVESDVIQQ